MEKKQNRIVVGYLIVENSIHHRYSMLVPRDQRFPKLLVNTSNWPTQINLKNGTKESKDLFYAILPIWENYKFPIGYVR